MATYAIGDVQGCFNPLQRLLDKVQFNPAQDQLWFAGDLVNRGPHSLEVLRFIKGLGASAISVLGNHDLHLLACAHTPSRSHPKDTLSPLLTATDRDDLLHWLRHRPLLHSAQGFTLTHAGLPPMWTLPQAQAYAQEVEAALQGPQYTAFLAELYGNEPHTWHPNLTGLPRLRLITNYFTRMRFCTAQGQLELRAKKGAEQAPEGYLPWFKHPHSGLEQPILFGHWAALEGHTGHPKVHALDTGCVWGKHLTLLCLDTLQRTQVKSQP